MMFSRVRGQYRLFDDLGRLGRADNSNTSIRESGDVVSLVGFGGEYGDEQVFASFELFLITVVNPVVSFAAGGLDELLFLIG